MLKKLAEVSPVLAELLEKALQDGVVSPEVVRALELAAQHINEDVANSLRLAGMNINESVANSLRNTGENISGALDRFESVSNTLNDITRPHGQGGIIDQLDKTADNIRRYAEWIDGVVTPPPPRIVVAWKWTFYAFVAGLVVGVIILPNVTHR